MTAQAREILFINNERFTFFGEPLEAYLEANKDKVNFDYQSTGCWRGYIGTWKLENNKLYLIDLHGTKYISETKAHVEVALDYLFPNHKVVFASWFSGHLEIPHGESKQDSITPFDGIQFLKFDKGVFIDHKYEDALEKILNQIQVKEFKQQTGLWKKIHKWLIAKK